MHLNHKSNDTIKIQSRKIFGLFGIIQNYFNVKISYKLNHYFSHKSYASSMFSNDNQVQVRHLNADKSYFSCEQLHVDTSPFIKYMTFSMVFGMQSLTKCSLLW